MARMEIWSSEYYDREIEFSYSRLRACLWCKIHISWQMGCGQVPELLQCRTYEPAGNTTDLSHSKENFECIHEPLLNIPLTHVIDPWWTTFIAKSNQQTTAKYDWWTVQQRYAIEDFNWGVNQRKDISQGLLKKLMNWDLSPYGTKRMQMAQRNSPLFWTSSGLPSKLHEIPCSLRDWLPMQEGIQKRNPPTSPRYFSTRKWLYRNTCPSHKKFDWLNN